MAGAGGSTVLVADVPPTSQSVDDIKEYEKILKISDEIFAGTHPRLKVPEQFICKAPSRTLQSSIAPAVIDHAAGEQAKTVAAEPSLPDSRKLQIKATSSSAASPASAVPKSTSGIDPIFLTKSDDLVRAEIQLQRRRIENTLKDQAERSKFDTKQRTAAHESRPDLDVSDVLNQALEIVKPLPSPDISGTNDPTIPSDSVDENSLYSSRAPDSPLTWDYEKSANAELDRSTREHIQKESIDQQADARRVTEINSHSLQATTNQAIPPQSLTQPARPEKQKQQEELIPDEPEYSPPEPSFPVGDSKGDDDYQPPEVVGPARYATVRRIEPEAPQQSSLSPNVRVVRNHITSPAAPQPSRVSPLATAKRPSVQRILHSRPAHNDRDMSDLYSRQTSPEGPIAQQSLPRKRRRVQEPREQVALGPMDTPEPRIKPEPVSPPLFHGRSSRSHQTAEHPVYIDISSPHYIPLEDHREVISREPVYELDRYGSDRRDFNSPAEASGRAVSRLSVRRPVRDSQDLRRVASLHNARNPDPANPEFIEPILRPRTGRTSPYVVVERQPNEKATYYEEIAPNYPRRYTQYEDYNSHPRYREVYVEDESGRQYIEPAPARRIVVDEYGNQYYEMVPASKVRATSSIPTRVMRPDEYAEHAYVRNASVRAASIVDDGYGNRRYVQEMAPPPATGTYRRVTEHGRNVSDNQRLYSSRPVVDREPVFRSGSVAVEYAPRQATYIEQEMPRERLIRTSSVRPPPSRYEQHREGTHRVQSVRPSGHEINIYMDDDGHRVAREYSERPGYTAVRPERENRYITDEDGTRLVIDGSSRVVPRY